MSLRFVERPIRERTTPRRVRVVRIAVVATALVAALAVTFGLAAASPVRAGPISPLAVARLEQERAAGQGTYRVLVVGEIGVYMMRVGIGQRIAPHTTGALYSTFECGVLPGKVLVGTVVLPLLPQCGDPVDVYDALISAFRPNAVVVWLGDQEVLDHVVQRSVVSVGSPEWSAELGGFLDRIRTIARGSGSNLVVATQPCAPPGTTRASSAAARQDEERVAVFNATVRAYARSRQLAVADVANYLCPGGRPVGTLDGAPPYHGGQLTTSGATALWHFLGSRAVSAR